MTPTTPETLETLQAQRSQLEQLHRSGVLTQTQFDEAAAALAQRIAHLASVPQPVPLSAATYASAAPVASAPQSAGAARPSWPTLAAMAAGVLVLALAGYAWKGAPGALLGSKAGAQQAQAQDAPALGAEEAAQVAAMTEKLAQRLKEQPGDVQGWTMLGRAYRLLGRPADSALAYASAYKLNPTDPNLLVEYAEALAVANNDLGGEPIALLETALKIDPANLKGLYLAGMHAFTAEDYPQAVQRWEKLVGLAPPGDGVAEQMEPLLAQARQRAGMPAVPAANAAAKPEGTSAPASAQQPAASKTVSGTVTLAAALAAQAQPEDTVFVFARAAQGPRMPLAILRKQVKDLPLAFTLDDSTAMSAANTLSSAGTVVVGARISKSGNAMPQSGDLQGQSEPVAVGASGLRIEIREVVKP